MKRLLWLFIGVPAAVLLIVFSVANRHAVVLRLDPFNAENPVFALQMPFFVFLFTALLVGMAIGGLTVWISQRRYRRGFRQERARADMLNRRIQAAAPRLPASDRPSRAA